ncbi:hypothetical protein G2W53_030317 [Senna tora]|uniref:Uncharacterized protein n=1 Tax=Senna tora TaxID=362788 RepID=A0A834WCT2_9FABA|nr:hypothetical protein G2W53_030317 [Senna tora]
MNSESDSNPAIVSGDKSTSKSTLPFPSLPGNAEILPSNLLARPLRIATGLPHPKSLSYIGNRGELPMVIDAPSKFPSGKHLGFFSQSSTNCLTVASSWAFTLLLSCSAHQRRSRDITSPAVAYPVLKDGRYLAAFLPIRIVALLPHQLHGVHVALPSPDVRSGFQLLNCFAAEAENSLPEGVEEIPEGGAVGDGVIDGAADEDAVSKLGDLNGHNRAEMTAVTNFSVKSEEFLEGLRDIGRGEEVADEESRGNDVEKIDASVVAGDVDVTVGVSVEAAGERGKVRESARESGFEERDEGIGRERRESEEAAFLDVVTGEHGKVGDGELEVSERGFFVWKDGAFGNESGCRRHFFNSFLQIPSEFG